ncbi:MAG: UDP-glucuronic acid decarboxylase family protein [Patescibacteria group bacterium]
MKKILITGGAGFIGSNLCRYLLAKGHKVLCLDNFFSSKKSSISGLLDDPHFEFISHDIIEPISLSGVDCIYHLACPASPPNYQKDPIYTFRTSVWGTYNILQVARENQARVLLASTSEIYGDPFQHPQTETYWGNVNPIGPRSCYDEGKRASETLFMAHYNMHSLDIKIVRIFNTYGPYMGRDDGRVVSNFINQALNNQDITIYGDGTQTRSFQYIDDLVNGLVKMMNSEDDFVGPVNLGNPGEYTVAQLAEFILKLLPESKSKVVYKDLPINDPKKRKPDISLAKAKLDWKPVIELERGLTQTIDYFRITQ